MQKDKRRTR